MTATEVTIPNNSSLLYEELIKQKLTGDDLWSYLYCGYAAVVWRSRNPAASVAAIEATLAACDAGVREALAGTDLPMAYQSVENTGLAAAKGAIKAAGGDAAGLLGSLVSEAARTVRQLLLPEADKFPDWQAGAFSTQASEQILPDADAVLGVIAKAVAADPDLRSALDTFAVNHGNMIGLAWPAPGSTTANKDALAQPADWPAFFTAGLQADGSIVVPVQSLSDAFNEQILAAATVASAMSGQVYSADVSILGAPRDANFALGDLSVDFNVVLGALSSATRPTSADASAAAAKASQANAAALKYAQNGLSGIAKVIGLIDPEAGTIVNAVSTAVFSAASAISDFAKTTTTLAQFLGQEVGDVVGEVVGDIADVADVVGGALLTGNLLGAAMNIIGLFTGGGQNPEMAMLDNIQNAIVNVSQQVASLQKDVDTRLDHIDSLLSQTLQQIVTGFGALIDLTIINENTLAGIVSQLVQLAEQVNRIDLDIQSWLQLVEVQTDLLEQGENPVLDWWYTHVDPADVLPYSGADPSFETADNIFYSWATGIAVSEPQITVSAPADPVSIAAQLAKPLSWDINVIAGALTNLQAASFYAGSAGLPLPNPVVWARSASDYAELQLEWPAYGQKLNPQRIADVAAPGLNLLGALDTLATLSHPAGVPAVSPVFDGVRDGYLAALAGQPALAGSPASLTSALGTALETWGTQYVGANQSALPSGTTAPDPFGPVDQPLTLGNVAAWGPPNTVPLGNAPTPSEQASVVQPNQAHTLGLLPPVLHNYFYFHPEARGDFALVIRDAGFLNPVNHIKWNAKHTDETDWVTGTYGATADIYYNADNSPDQTSWPLVLHLLVNTGVHGGGSNTAEGNQDTYTWVAQNWAAVLSHFNSNTQSLPLTPDEQQIVDTITATLTPIVTSDLLALQTQACGYLATQVTAGTSLSSGQALSAWQQLMIQLIQLALPGRILRDDLLRCLMYGPQAPPGPAGVAAMLTLRAEAQQLGTDVIAEIAATAAARIGALHDAVLNALLALESAGVYDWPPDVVSALQRLQIAAAARPDGPAITLPARSQAMAPIDPAAWYILAADGSENVLAASSTGAVTAVPADGTGGQQWQLQVQPDASYQVVARATGQCLGVTAADLVVQQSWSNTSQQRWYPTYERPGYARLVNAASGQSLTAAPAGANALGQVLTQTFNGAGAQQFAIRPATPPVLQTAVSIHVSGPLGGSGTAPLTISNLGNLPLTITSITASGPFSVSPTSAQVQPDSALTVNVTFSPSGSGPASGTLTISSNDAHSPATVALAGTAQGLAAPEIEIDGTDAHGGYLVGITGAAGADFFFTTDGSDPTPKSTPFVAEFDVNPQPPSDITVKAIAFLASVGTSPVASLDLQPTS
jgi:HYDIN/CFA65/VesB family protein/ricin-type beta-trefoil lectin protein/chitobiase/beta-hexosaminidase-like protein